MTTGDSTSQVVAPNSPANGQGEGQPQQPEQNRQKQQTRINLYELPEFRQIQAQWNEKQRQLMLRLQELEERGLDDYQKKELEVRRLQQEIQERDAQINYFLQQQAELEAKRQWIAEILPEFPGVKEEDLLSASSSAEAVRIAKRLERERQAEMQRSEEKERAANVTDLSAGKSPVRRSEREEKLEAARRAGDGNAFWDAFLSG